MNSTTIAIKRLFEMDLSRWDIISLSMFPAFINLVIFFYVMFSLPRNRTSYSFSVFVFLMSMWQFSDSMMRLCIEAQCAGIWYRIMGIFAILVIPFGIIFICHFGKWYKILSSSIFFIFQFVPALFFIIINTSGIPTHTIVYSKTWHWIANPLNEPITQLIYLWITFEALLLLSLIWYLYFKSKDNPIKRKQTLLIAIGISLPLLGGTIAQSVIPIFFNLDNIPLTATFFTFFSVFSLISLVHYKLLEFSPKQQWKQIVETMNDGLIILNLKNEVLFANNKLLQMSGYSKEEIIGSNPQMLYNDSIVFNTPQQLELPLTTKNKETIWTMMCSSPYIDSKNKLQGSIIICTNINESKRSEARFRTLIENAGDIIMLSDNQSKILYTSPAMGKIVGFSNHELINHSITEIVHPEYVEQSKANLQMLLNHPNKLFTATHKFKHKNGKTLWLEGKSINLISDENVQSIVCNLRDVSILKENESQLKNLLKTSNSQNERLQNFAHIVSHNIRSHVVNINGLVKLLSTSQDDIEKVNLKRMLVVSTNKLLETTDNLSDIITIQNNKDIKWSNINLHDEINNTAQILHTLGDNKVPTINNHVSKDCIVNVIPSYLESIVLNLLTNAVKYSKPDTQCTIDLSCEISPEYITLHIEDNGIGIDLKTNQNKIFGMYKTFSNNKNARGLGLFIIKNQIEAMYGTISVSSTLGIGSKFTVQFNKQISEN